MIRMSGRVFGLDRVAYVSWQVDSKSLGIVVSYNVCNKLNKNTTNYYLECPGIEFKIWWFSHLSVDSNPGPNFIELLSTKKFAKHEIFAFIKTGFPTKFPCGFQDKPTTA